MISLTVLSFDCSQVVMKYFQRELITQVRNRFLDVTKKQLNSNRSGRAHGRTYISCLLVRRRSSRMHSGSFGNTVVSSTYCSGIHTRETSTLNTMVGKNNQWTRCGSRVTLYRAWLLNRVLLLLLVLLCAFMSTLPPSVAMALARGSLPALLICVLTNRWWKCLQLALCR